MADEADGGRRAGGALDPAALIRSRAYRRLLVFSGIIGIVISAACWAFLEAIHGVQVWAYEDLPDALGFKGVPWWWPLPVLLVAGVLIALAVDRLPGTGGHEPAEGLKVGGQPTTPNQLPGIILAALASIALGLVLGPEAPLIALGGGLTLLLIGVMKRETPDQAKIVLVAASSFAALATIFGSPIVGAIIIIEAAGLAGPTLPLVLLPGLIAAGIGSLVFIGVGSLTGLSTQAYAMAPLSLPPYGQPNAGDLLWTIVLAAAAAGITFAIVAAGRRTEALVKRRRLAWTVLAALSIAGLAIVFAQISGESANAVLFSGQEALTPVVSQGAGLTLGTLMLLLVCKGIAWALSLGSARGGPTFPAIFLGVVGGLLAAHLPGFAETPAVGVLVGAAVVSVLRLPLSAIVIALLISQGGAGVAPLIIVGVVVAYIVVVTLDARIAQSSPASEPSG
jgi:chloride channel protein, CIC family